MYGLANALLDHVERANEYVPATRRRRYCLQRARIAIGIMQIA
jgi:hypothetical protein